MYYDTIIRIEQIIKYYSMTNTVLNKRGKIIHEHLSNVLLSIGCENNVDGDEY